MSLARRESARKSEAVNLHDWIDELCDALDIETEVDEALVLDLAKVAADNVIRKAAPITTYLLGYAAELAQPRGQRPAAADRGLLCAFPRTGGTLRGVAWRRRTASTSCSRRRART